MLARAVRWSRSRLPAAVTGGAPAPATIEVPAGHEELVEGLAKVIYRKGAVFYNPAQVVNRDLSVLILRWLQRQRGPNSAPLRVLEALSATGLRAVRYASEVPNVACVTANDLDPGAVETIRRNVAYNGLEMARLVTPNLGDAIDVMIAARDPASRYDVVDLDPYGGAAIFLDSAVQAVSDGGLLAVTCTDLAVLCGNSPETCFARYGSTPLKGSSTHEMAVRIVLFAINAAANRHGRSIEVVLCCKIDFYVRLFVRIRDSRATTKLSASRCANVHQCSSCGTQRFQTLGRIKENAPSNSRKRRRREAAFPVAAVAEDIDSAAIAGPAASAVVEADAVAAGVRKYAAPSVGEDMGSRCSICQGTMVVGGPIWAGPLVGKGVGDSILSEIATGTGTYQARDRVDALVRVAAEELEYTPLFLQLNNMCKVLKCAAPPAASLRSCLVGKGYLVSQSHTDPLAIKTNAPPEILWDILRLWCKKTVVNKKGTALAAAAIAAGETPVVTTGERILAQQPTHVAEGDVDFSIKRDSFVRGNGSAMGSAPRFLPNPEPNWGPKARANSRQKRTHNGVDAPKRYMT
jgi:tRNA (guanine26-N2/guanine27-N2)-dimethyltransferase